MRLKKKKNTLEGTKSRIKEAEDRISEVDDRMVEINETVKTKWNHRYIAWRQGLRRCKKGLART